MFSFIGRLFGKSKKEEEGNKKDEKAEKEIPYSLDFEGADQIDVVAEDCSRKNIVAVGKLIVRPEEIAKIVDLLESLPEEGVRPVKMQMCMEHSLTAYKYDEPFAKCVFYKGMLKFPNGLFIDNNPRAEARQKELFKLIEVRPKMNRKV